MIGGAGPVCVSGYVQPSPEEMEGDDDYDDDVRHTCAIDSLFMCLHHTTHMSCSSSLDWTTRRSRMIVRLRTMRTTMRTTMRKRRRCLVHQRGSRATM